MRGMNAIRWNTALGIASEIVQRIIGAGEILQLLRSNIQQTFSSIRKWDFPSSIKYKLLLLDSEAMVAMNYTDDSVSSK
jgi:hypothetical protein